MAIPPGPQHRPGQVHEIRPQIGIRQVEFPPLPLPVKDGAGLHGQVVDGQMGRSQIHGLNKLPAPVAQGIRGLPKSGEPLNQIQAPAGERPLRVELLQPARRLQQVPATMAPTQRLKHVILETLAPEAGPVDACGHEAVQAGPVKAGRIQLHGDLRAGREAETSSEGRQHSPHLLRGEHGWRATAEVHR